MNSSDPSVEKPVFGPAAIGALAHLYRGEVYRSTVWRNRLDATTNWAVVATGIALSVTFSSAAASPLPLALVGLLVAVFLVIEARRYRFFDFWRIRAHVLELHFFGPMLLGQGVRTDNGWNKVLYKDYFRPNLHITFMESVGRRLRHNYGFIFGIQVVAYLGKILIHPTRSVRSRTSGPAPRSAPFPASWSCWPGSPFTPPGSPSRSGPCAANAARPQAPAAARGRPDAGSGRG